jgi:hypothetical protein
MTYKGDPIAAKLDKIAGVMAGATGLTRMQRRLNSGRRTRFRVIPLALLACAVAGLWVQIERSEYVGYLIVMLAWMIGGSIQAFSPMGPHGGKLDEREAALVRSGHSAGLLAAMVVAVLGCIVLGLGNVAQLFHLGHFWSPTGTDWFALAFLLLAVETNVATLAASAATPEPVDDDEG